MPGIRFIKDPHRLPNGKARSFLSYSPANFPIGRLKRGLFLLFTISIYRNNEGLYSFAS